jgi:two-component system OmpR family response regulator
MAILRAGEMEVDLESRRVVVRDRAVKLSKKQLALLVFLMKSDGEAVSRMTLLHRVFEYQFDPGNNLVDVHISNLRQKIDVTGQPSYIETVRGVGYRFRIPIARH